MKYRALPLLFFLAPFFIFLAACSSTPPPAPGAPPGESGSSPAPASAAPLAELSPARERAEEARERARDFDAPRYFPPDWERAEGKYQALGGEPGGEALADKYNEATRDFEELFQNSLSRCAQDREAEIMEARERATGEGARELLPGFLIQADKTALEALSRYEEGEYYSAVERAALALALYRALETGTKAYRVRLEIEARDLYHFVPEAFDTADEAGDGAIRAYQEQDAAEAGLRAGEALDRYQAALAAALEALAAGRRAFAEEERRIAQEIKADVAARGDFAAAGELYDRGERAFGERDYERAANLYEEAGLLFNHTQRNALEKRRIAEDALRNTRARLNASAELARNAELTLQETDVPGGSSSLGDNQYLQALRLRVLLAHDAYQRGDYDASLDYAAETLGFAQLSDEYVALQLRIREAGDLILRAQERLAGAASAGIPRRYPAEYGQAEAEYTAATRARSAEDWEEAIAAASRALHALAELEYFREAGTLPAQYTVRAWNPSEDCFWNIAAQPWAYGDSSQWRRLYNANRSKLPNPNNPNVIAPGTVLDIPVIRGEVRRGMWTPGQTYTSLPPTR